MDGDKQAEFVDDGGHRQPSIARDGAGRMHVFASMHDDGWRYFRSSSPATSPQNRSHELPDQGEEVTYPIVDTAPNGDIYLIARVDAWADDSRAGRLYRWNNQRGQWSTVAKFAEAFGKTVYPDDIKVDSQGNVHILWEWSRTPSMAWRHKLSYLKYNSATNSFVTSTGSSARVPVTPETADVIQPFEGNESFAWSGITGQSAKLTLAGTSPVVAYRYRPPGVPSNLHVRYARPRTGGGWNRSTVYSASQTAATIDVTWDPTTGPRVYFATTFGNDRLRLATRRSGSWHLQSITPGIPVDRVVAERHNGSDNLYIVDQVNARLIFGRL